METQTLNVIGMHCASCSAIISKKLKKLPGVESCNVNYTTEKATISFNSSKVDIGKLNSEIKKLGYKFEDKHSMNHSRHLGLSQSKEEKIKELNEMKIKLLFVLPFTILIFAFMMWEILAQFIPSLPMPDLPMKLVNTFSFLISIPVMFFVGKPFLNGVVRFVKYRVANMDTLIGIGTLTAFVYSSIIFLFPEIINFLNLPEYVYFDVVIVVIGFVTLGKYLEAKSKLKTGEAIEKLMNLGAKTAIVKRDGKEIEILLTDVLVDDIIIVKPGIKIPTDGVIVQGKSTIDESMINGESIPTEKKEGDVVIGGTLNKQGAFMFRATKIGSETMLSQIIKMVEDAQNSKAEIENLADKISSYFVPIVLGFAILTFFVWISLGSYFLGFSQAFSFGLLSFVGILVIACPCALGLAIPTALIVGTGKGAQNGILIKNANSLEKLYKVKTLALDKTGTITNGKPKVTDVVVLNDKFSEKQIIGFCASVENFSSHPLAQAILEKAKNDKVRLFKAENFKETEGNGVVAAVGGYNVEARKPKPVEYKRLEEYLKYGKTVISVVIDDNLVGALIINDTVKENASAAIKRFKKMGVKTVMITGDNKKTAGYIADQIEVDDVISEVIPQEKAKIIKELQEKKGLVAMAGDGINDAPALSKADVGIAMATGTDVAIESSDIVLLNGDISKIPQVFELSRITMRTIKQNLFWAFIYNIVGIPIAAGLLYPFFGIVLNPVFAGMAMALSSVSVVGNSLLLKRARI